MEVPAKLPASPLEASVGASCHPVLASPSEGTDPAPALGPCRSSLALTGWAKQKNTLSQYQFLQSDPYLDV